MLETFYRELYRIRRVEEWIAELYPTAKIMSPVHLSIGQEAISVAVCQALAPADVVFGTDRCHALYLAKGGGLRRMIAELYGKAIGAASSMHMIDVPTGVRGASAVVGSTIPQAVGYALAEKIRGQATIVACFFGEGAVEERVFHESLNFAAFKGAPVLFVCENNAYAVHARQADRQARGDISALARAHGIPTMRFDDLNIFRIHEHARRAVEEIRAGLSGPQFFECPCYRWKEHVGPGTDFQAGYRSAAEATPWMQNDALRQLSEMIDGGARAKIEGEIETDIEDAFGFAEESPFPDERELLPQG